MQTGQDDDNWTSFFCFFPILLYHFSCRYRIVIISQYRSATISNELTMVCLQPQRNGIVIAYQMKRVETTSKFQLRNWNLNSLFPRNESIISKMSHPNVWQKELNSQTCMLRTLYSVPYSTAKMVSVIGWRNQTLAIRL